MGSDWGLGQRASWAMHGWCLALVHGVGGWASWAVHGMVHGMVYRGWVVIVVMMDDVVRDKGHLLQLTF